MTTLKEEHCPVKAGPTERKLSEFRDFKAGWNSGEGEAFKSSVVDAALRLLAHLESYGYTETDAFPGLAGEISVKGYGHSQCIEVFAESDNTFTFAVPKQDEYLVYLEGLDEYECLKQISWTVPTKSISASSTPSIISTVETSASQALLLAAKMGRSLSSVSSAPFRQAQLCANT